MCYLLSEELSDVCLDSLISLDRLTLSWGTDTGLFTSPVTSVLCQSVRVSLVIMPPVHNGPCSQECEAAGD